MTSFAYAFVLALAVERVAEVAWSRRNTRKLIARGAQESGAGHYPFIVLLHVVWLGAIVLLLPRPGTIYAIPFVLFILLQACRVWVVTSLGSSFTTRIISLPGAPLVRSGPYRFFRHPNYLVVMGEVLVFPLIFGEITVAVVFSVINALLLTWRIRVEDAALAVRR